MTEETPKKKKKILKIFLISLASLILVLLVGFWLVTSSSFITGVILPMVSSSIDMRISAEEIDLSLFKSRMEAKGLQIGSGKTKLVKADSFNASFSLPDLLNGRLVFYDVSLNKAVITIAKDADGKWTYDSSAQNSHPKPEKNIPQKTNPASPNEPEKVFINLKNIKITDSSFILEAGEGKTPARMEFSGLNINLPEFTNNKPAELTLKSNVSVQSDTGITVQQGIWNLSLKTSVDDYLLPYEISLDSKLNKLDGIINGVKINDSNLVLNLEASGDKKSITVKKLYLRQVNGNWVKTNVEFSSYINFEPLEVKGKFKIAPLSPEIISIITQFTRGVNPGKVGIDWISDFEYSEAGFAGDGKLKLTRKEAAVISGKKYELPDLTLTSKYNIAFNSSNKALKVSHFTTELQERGNEVLSLSANRPFTYLIDKQMIVENKKPQIILQIKQLDLTLAKLLHPPDKNFSLNSGRLDGIIAFGLGDNKKMLFGGKLKAADLDFQIDSQRFSHIGIEQRIVSNISKDIFISIPEYSLKINRDNANIINLQGSGNINPNNDKAVFSVKLVDFSSRKIAALPLPPDMLKQLDSSLNKLEPFSVNAGISGIMDKGNIKLEPISCELVQRNKKVIGITLAPHEGKAENIAEKSEAVIEFFGLPIGQFGKLAGDNTIRDGYLNGKITAQIQKKAKNVKLDSSLNVNRLELASGKKLFSGLQFNLDSAASLKDFEQVNIKNFVLGLKHNNSAIMGISASGKLQSREGNGNFNISLNELDYRALNIALPGEFRSGTCNGKFKLAFKNHFKNLEADSTLNVKNLIGGALLEAINGKSSFNISLEPNLFMCRKFLIDLSDAKDRIALVNGSTTVPPSKSLKPVVIRLNSEIIDIRKLKQLFGTETEASAANAGSSTAETTPAENAPYKPPKPLKFDLGERPYLLLVNLQGIKYNSILSAHVNGEIAAKGKSISIKNIDIYSNKDTLKLKGGLLSTDAGIKYQCELKTDEFNLTPVLKTFLPPELKATECTIRKYELNLAGTGLQPKPLWDNMKGYVKSDLANIKVPNTFSKTMIGKIILLPFTIMEKMQDMIPGKAAKAMGKVASYVKDFNNDIKLISFTSGQMNLGAEDGLIYIRDFHFNGPIVNDLSFIGQLGLGTREMLNLNSSLNISGIVLPVDMQGTVRKPEINYSKTSVKFMTANTFNILDTTGKILKEGGGDLKKSIENIFDSF